MENSVKRYRENGRNSPVTCGNRSALQRWFSGKGLQIGKLGPVVFSGKLRQPLPMDKRMHGQLLKAAMAARGLNRTVVADSTGVRVRTVTNWTSGATMPSEAERVTLRRLLGEYDDPGDAVEVALRRSDLEPWRASALIAEYQRHLHEQQREATG